MNKIEAIMEEAEIQLYDNGDSGASDMSNLRAILEKHLQDTTEEREVEIKINKHSNIVNINCTLCKHCSFGNETVLKSYKYCPGCGAKIKRIP